MELKEMCIRDFLLYLILDFALYRNRIEPESNLAYAGDKIGLINARKLYESVLATYYHDSSLWHDYYCFKIKKGTSETAAAVHELARKTLKKNIAQL